MITERSKFDLAGLRESCRPFFIRWDAAVVKRDSALARAERRSMLAHTRVGLSVRTADAAGIYIFHRSRGSVEIGDMAYIGIAEGLARPMRTRIEDRLRDDSCFDVGLDELPRHLAAEIIRQRLRVAMPTSKKDYTSKHLSTCDLVSGSSQILLNATNAEPWVIKDAERLLIASAAVLHAPLLNKKLLRFVGRASYEGSELARSLIVGLPNQGWSQASAASWLTQIEELSRQSTNSTRHSQRVGTKGGSLP